MKKRIIVGASDFATLLYSYFKEQNMEIEAFCVEEEYKVRDTWLNTQVISCKELSRQYNPSECELYMAIGYKHMNAIREKLYKKCTEMGFAFANYIHPTAYVSPGAVLGEGNIILEMTCIGPNCRIGNGNLFWMGCKFVHDNSIGDFNTICAGVVSNGFVSIASNCFIGSGSVIRNNICISDHSFVGAASFVGRNVNRDCSVIPDPPKIYKNSADHYCSLI